MHNAAFQHLGIDASYVHFSIKPENLKKGIEALKLLDIKGFNVTLPHKESVLRFLDELAEEAKLIGAVNTVVKKDERLIGYNTDAKGFIIPLKEKTSVKGKVALVMGAGGSAKAVSYILLKEKIGKIFIANRTLERAKKLSSSLKKLGKETEVKVLALDEIKTIIKEVDILINTTPVGMFPGVESCIIDESLLRKLNKDAIVYDLVYNPLETKLLKLSKKFNLETISGIEMLVHQAALAFEIWTSKKAPVDVMKKAAVNALNLFSKNK